MLKKIYLKLFGFKRWFYKRVLSDNGVLIGKPTIMQPCLFIGEGKVNIKNSVMLGYYPSPYYYSGYMHIEARHRDAVISIDENTIINNNAVLISDGAGICIGKNCFIGQNFTVLDSDFHKLEIDKRNQRPSPELVKIEDNVFIGCDVKIFKGVSIGKTVLSEGEALFLLLSPQTL